MKRIQLTKGQVALVDAADFKKFGHLKWNAWWSDTTGSFYATSRTGMMHRAIMRPPKGMEVDHKNHNTLDNRRRNLRVCTKSQNMMNRKGLNANNTSGYRGVSWDKKNKKWSVHIQVNGNNMRLGRFADLGKAAAVYADANRRYFGEFGGKLT